MVSTCTSNGGCLHLCISNTIAYLPLQKIDDGVAWVGCISFFGKTCDLDFFIRLVCLLVGKKNVFVPNIEFI